MSTSPPQNATGSEEILCQSTEGVRSFILNRPKKLNALHLPMVQTMLPKLQAWENNQAVNVVLIKSGGGKGFCAGGDVKAVVDWVDEKNPKASAFFETEYQLDHFIATLATPFISVMDGITMGGGVGLSVHAPFRIATEKTLFAMPETAIGFLPDVGGSFFLPRLDGELGTYLGLTGQRLKASDVMYAGIATHYVPSSRLDELEKSLTKIDQRNHKAVNAAIEEYSADLDTEPLFSLRGPVRAAIDRCFKHNTVEAILAAVEKEDSAWGKETLKLLQNMSPTSLKVSLHQLRKGAHLSIAQCFKMEFQLVQKFFRGHDFKEGVNAVLVSRTQPEWQPATLDQVNDKTLLSEYFDSPSEQSLELLNTKDYKDSPYLKFALPTEEEIRQVVTGEAPNVGDYALSYDDVVEHFVTERKSKQGVRQKVAEVLDRKTHALGSGSDKSLQWSDE
ncbi:ClpP/crotonase-like domain-containing protein [Spinellus fusiger]|nr:ClpP/crotonase-like domain-containing protein [Spinellus fusiger]